MKNAHPVELLLAVALVAGLALLDLIAALVTLARAARAPEPVSPADELARAARAPLALLAPAPELSGNPGQLAPPAVAPLYADLAHLPVRQLMVLAGTRSKKYRRAELLAMVAAC
jgi:hypothetical protein